MASPLQRAHVVSVLEKSRYAQAAVATGSGPHATPAAFTLASGRLWLISSRATLKVRAIRRRPTVSLLLRAGERSLVVAGDAEVISAWGRDDVAALARNALPTLHAAISYGARNPGLMGGYLLDLMSCPAAAVPHDRVLVAVHPRRGLVIDGDAVVDTWGRWSRGQASLSAVPATAPGLCVPFEDIPAAAAATLTPGGEAALGWMTSSGPLVLPATLIDLDGRVRVPAAALQASGADASSAASITVDRDGLRPSRFAGVILRGRGTVVARRSGWATVAVCADRANWWTGFRTGTVRAGSAAQRPAV